MIWLHILAGALALLAGYTAMFASKGGQRHRQAGKLFVLVMCVMGGSGAWMAAIKPVRISVVAGLLVIYLVGTALLTVKRSMPAARPALLVLTALGLMVAGLAIAYGAMGLRQPKGALDGYPAPIYFAFGGIALLGVVLDARLLRAGSMKAKHRLARHLWRMEVAMYFAASAFFLGQAQLFPKAISQHTALLVAPVLLVLLHLGYWLWKTLGTTARVAPATLHPRSNTPRPG
jgi:uncharacterized membrane protein